MKTTDSKLIKTLSFVISISILYYLLYGYGGVEVVTEPSKKRLFVNVLEEQCNSLILGISLNQTQRILSERNKELIFSDEERITSLFWISDGEANEFRPDGFYCYVVFDRDDKLVDYKSVF